MEEGRELITADRSTVALAHTAASMKAQVQRIQQVMRAVMKRDVHYGEIPGTNKPTLYKAGSEVLLTTFHIGVDPIVDDLSNHDEVRYRVRAIGRHQPTGNVIGTGIGEASSNEEKYRWRKAVCREEFEATDEDRRRVKYAKGKGGDFYTIDQVRTVPADVANTVLKMAKKRAQIDLCLTALAASDCFTQDLEDMPEELREGMTEGDQQQQPRQAQKPATRQPQRNGNGNGGRGLATEKQRNLVGFKLDQSGIPEKNLLTELGIGSLNDLQFEQVDRALEFIATNSP